MDEQIKNQRFCRFSKTKFKVFQNIQKLFIDIQIIFLSMFISTLLLYVLKQYSLYFLLDFVAIAF